MEFEIKTIGESRVEPDIITFKLTFIEKDNNYTEVINKGAKQIIDFKDKIKTNDEQLKTISYRVEEKKKKIEKENKLTGKVNTSWEFSHYEIIQVLEYTIDFNLKEAFQIISQISRLKNPPTYIFEFSLTEKTRKEQEKIATERAISLAKEKARDVQRYLGFNNLELTKMSFIEAFHDDVHIGRKLMDFDKFCNFESKVNVENLSNSLIPEDIITQRNILLIAKIY